MVETIRALEQLHEAVGLIVGDAVASAREIRASVDRDLAALPRDLDERLRHEVEAAAERVIATSMTLGQIVTVNAERQRSVLRSRIITLEQYGAVR